MKVRPFQTTHSSLGLGLQLTGRACVNPREWVGKFAVQQQKHQYPKDNKPKGKFSEAMLGTLNRLGLNKSICGLCMIQKDNSQMEMMCKCYHKYCYSCLNSYAIMRIQNGQPVKCPQIQCSQSMDLRSKIYSFLPNSVKLKYLTNKHAYNIDPEDWLNRCQRCLSKKHQGQCKMTLTPQVVEQTFKHRLCPKCLVQVRLTSGKRKVTCSKCNVNICYLCGHYWNDKHQCKQEKNIYQLQDRGSCCEGCGRNLGYLCCQILFSCQRLGLGCCLWNIFSIPIRLIFTLLVFTIFSLYLILAVFVITLWLTLSLVGGFTYQFCSILFDTPFPISLLLLILYPFVSLYGTAIVASQTSSCPGNILGGMCEAFCQIFYNIWVKMSPGNCRF